MPNPETSHWYFRDGRPCYLIPMRDGRMRSPTMRDAKRGLKGVLEPYAIVPSVTTILHGLGVPRALSKWMVKTALECAATNPVREGETADAYYERMQADADRTRDEAAQLGTDIHAGIEKALHNHKAQVPLMTDVPAAMRSYVEPIAEWIRSEVADPIAIEQSFAMRVYGGKVDLYCELNDTRRAVVDFKTQNTSSQYGHEPRVYDEWAEQLAAYAIGLGRPVDAWLNVVTSTAQPGKMLVHDWTPVRDQYARMWSCKLQYYQLVNQWWPPETEV